MEKGGVSPERYRDCDIISYQVVKRKLQEEIHDDCSKSMKGIKIEKRKCSYWLEVQTSSDRFLVKNYRHSVYLFSSSDTLLASYPIGMCFVKP
jgi:hypothetical protein